ncbi:hypothetical protein PILCRDRAFT_84268 [Piloderma croceum F 1598]|uniref:Uncharacterized protein n=1 Tax=Piloderma croceum (strain F 1598) TaxID=765440 RepID=A0A0C3GHK0_PILCF|nr:hypothetical protein PILCRDRAFT_84268 [Piloderma croceum F 1598]
MCEGHKGKPILRVLGLWADATALQEAEGNWPDNHPAAKGLVYQLGPKDPHEVLRCHKNIRPVFSADDTHPNGPYALPLDALELKGLHYTSSALLFDFGQAWLEVNFLLHTSTQLFSKEVWVNSICKMEKSSRPFKVAMAIEFDDHVLAFLSKDLIFQGTWARTKDTFKKYPEIGEDLNGFIENVLEKLIRPAYRDGLLAPTLEQRKSYMRWLHVYARDRTWMPDRMGELLAYYNYKIDFLSKQHQSWSRAETTDLYDVFEPTYLREALELPHQNFGPLIFGKEEWVTMGAHVQRTYLRPSFYKPLTSRQPAFMRIKVESVKNRDNHLFSHLISGNDMAIGPLEYYGNAFIYKAAGGYKKVAVAKKDPMIPEHYSVQLAKGKARKELGLDHGKK